MKKLLSGLCATALAFTFAVSAAVPVNAAPIIVPKADSKTDVQLAQFRPEWRQLQRRGIRMDRRQFRRDFRLDRRDFRRDRDYGWYRGYRGYRYYRPGYRRYNDFWFPAAAFITGAIIGGAIANQPRVYGGSSHVEWCYNRYRSYRAYDNTYQPYNGPRRQCYSPYS